MPAIVKPSTTPIPKKPPVNPLLLGGMTSPSASTFGGKTAEEIVTLFKSGDKSLYKQLMKNAHPDYAHYNSSLRDLANTVANLAK